MNNQNDTQGTGSRVRAWLELVRLPNLFTVPGDPLAGFILASALAPDLRLVTALPCLVSSLCLYIAGLALNDIVDRREDAIHRPARPLPSGRITPAAALSLAVLSGAAGLAAAALAGTATLAVAVLLAAAVILYNAAAKRSPFFGPLAMGLCRGLSLLLGAAGVEGLWFSMPVVIAAACLFCYISSVTIIASRETEETRGPVHGLFLPLSSFAFPFVALALVLLPDGLSFRDQPLVFSMIAVPGLAVVLATGMTGLTLARGASPAEKQRSVGRFIRALVLIQAAFCALVVGPGTAAALGVMLLWPATLLLSKRFYQS